MGRYVLKYKKRGKMQYCEAGTLWWGGCSYVNFLLGLSPVNPVIYNLPFEKYFNGELPFRPNEISNGVSATSQSHCRHYGSEQYTNAREYKLLKRQPFRHPLHLGYCRVAYTQVRAEGI